MLGFSAHHINLISACYPSNTTLASTTAIGPDASSLSKLVYYTSNRPAKLNKVVAELQLRVTRGQRKIKSAWGTNYVLISLGILHKLVIECSRDLNLFAAGVLSALLSATGEPEVSLQAELIFADIAILSDGTAIGVDETYTANFLELIKRSATGALSDDSRQHIPALKALSHIVSSSILYLPSQYQPQVKAIVPSLLHNINLSEEILPIETSALPSKPSTSKLRLSSSRIEEEQDKKELAISSFRILLSKSSAAQFSVLLSEAILSSIQWNLGPALKSFFLSLNDWTPVQHRYIIPVTLILYLIAVPETVIPSQEQMGIITIVAHLLRSRSQTGLAFSEAIGNLLSLIQRRVKFKSSESPALSSSPGDPYLALIQDATGFTGSHIVYADQVVDMIQDIVAELKLTDNESLLISYLNCIEKVLQNSPKNLRNPISPSTGQELLVLSLHESALVRQAYARVRILMIEELGENETYQDNEVESALNSQIEREGDLTRFLHALSAVAFSILSPGYLSAKSATFPSNQVIIPKKSQSHLNLSRFLANSQIVLKEANVTDKDRTQMVMSLERARLKIPTLSEAILMPVLKMSSVGGVSSSIELHSDFDLDKAIEKSVPSSPRLPSGLSSAATDRDIPSLVMPDESLVETSESGSVEKAVGVNSLREALGRSNGAGSTVTSLLQSSTGIDLDSKSASIDESTSPISARSHTLFQDIGLGHKSSGDVKTFLDRVATPLGGSKLNGANMQRNASGISVIISPS